MVKLNEIYFFLCEAQNFLNSPRILYEYIRVYSSLWPHNQNNNGSKTQNFLTDKQIFSSFFVKNSIITN